MKKIFIFIIIFFSIPALVFSADSTYYLTENGAGGQDGLSLESAWAVSDFNNSINWDSSDNAAKIDPGDTVEVNGTITTSMTCQDDGTSVNVIIIDFSTGSGILDNAQFNFNDHNYITVTGWSVPSDQHLDCNDDETFNIGDILFNFGSSDHCTVQNGTSDGNTAYYLFSLGSSTNTTITGNTVTDFGHASDDGESTIIAGHIPNGTIISNNIFESTSDSKNTGVDIIKPAQADNTIITGNRLVLQAAKSGGDPHNDIIQFFSSGADYATNGTVSYNWIELNGASSAYNSFTMNQGLSGAWDVYGNFFYSHDQDSNSSGGNSWSGYPTYTLNFYNNTIIDDDGATSSFAGRSYSGAITINVKNNIFIQQNCTTGEIVTEHQVVSNGGTWVMDGNAWYTENSSGYVMLRINGGNSYSTCAEEVGSNGICLSEAQKNILFSNLSNGNFSLKTGAAVIGQGLDLSGSFSQLPSVGNKIDFPNPNLINVSSWDIGAYEYQQEQFNGWNPIGFTQ